MKTIKHLIQAIIFVILAINAKPTMAQEIQINGSFSSDTTFNPFNGEQGVYSFKMSGGIDFLSDSSLIRVVLIDDKGNHFLIYEAYPLIDTLYNFSINDICDETCYLDNIKPDSIRVDIINAIASIEKFTYDLTPINNIQDLQIQMKSLNDSLKVKTMNQRIQDKDMYWHADRTSFVQSSFQEKEKYFGKKFNLLGIEYYTGGIFEFIHHKDNYSLNTSNYVTEFDWRNRHSSNISGTPYYNPGNFGWITTPEYQGQTGLCWDYTASHTFADFVNIYCNRFKN